MSWRVNESDQEIVQGLLAEEIRRLERGQDERDVRLQKLQERYDSLALDIQRFRAEGELLRAENARLRMKPLQQSPTEPPSRLSELLKTPPRTICEVVQIGHSPQPNRALPDNESFCGEWSGSDPGGPMF